jgi:hypothetical protein
MSPALSFYERHSFYEELTWWFVRERIGQGLREYYEVPTELPPKLLALVKKLAAVESKHRLRASVSILDAIEGNYLLRYVSPVEPRSIGPSDNDWPLCT